MHLSTLVFQTVNFLVLVWVLARLLYRPVQRMVARRQAEVAETLAKADAARAAAEAARAEVTRQQADAAGARDRLLAEAARDAEAGRAALLTEARQKVDEALAVARRQLEDERIAQAAALHAKAAELAVTVAARLLADVGPQAATARMLEQALDAIRGLDAHERARLIAEVARGEHLRVVTAMALTADARASSAKAISDLLGVEAVVDFAEDPALLAGAEVHLPHAVVRQSWRDHLVRIRGELAADDIRPA